jgi:hypothetical protein
VFFLFVSRAIPSPSPRVFSFCVSNPFSWPQVLLLRVLFLYTFLVAAGAFGFVSQTRRVAAGAFLLVS